MGNNSSLFSKCYSQDLPSSRNCIEDYGLSATGPIKVVRKKCSFATTETISIQPMHLISNRSSVTEFVVNKNETTESARKSQEKHKSQIWSAISSPGRIMSLEATEVFARNSRKEGVNLVTKVRSRSLASTPKHSIGYNKNENTILQNKLRESLKAKESLKIQEREANEDRRYASTKSKKKNTCFEPLNLERSLKKRYYT